MCLCEKAPIETEQHDADDEKKEDEEKTLPTFVKGESGPHKPNADGEMDHTATLLYRGHSARAMETAGKFVEDEELRAAMKENGIGRPSSRASIIETLFKRHYIRREKKRLVATPTGIELIDMIKEELLKSCELTGIWEKKLRDIEHKKYDPAQFINELKEQITAIVNQVMSDNSNRRVTITTEEDLKKKPGKPRPKKTKKAKNERKPSKATSASDPLVGQPCPVCGKGHIIKGKTAYGCSEWKSGCTFRQPFESPS